jgi:AcrR family transcriptional regulator
VTTDAPRRRMARADRRDQLVEVAEQVFVERGYGPASMDDVADRAGVTKPVLYDHFGSKDGLLAAVLEGLGEEMLQRTLEASAAEQTPEGQLAAGLHAYFQFVEQHRGGWALLLREVAPGTAAAAAVDAARQAQVEHIAVAVAQHLPHPDPALAAVYAHAVSGAAERLAAVRLEDPTFTAAAAAADLMDVMWLGFATLQSGGRWRAGR